MAKIRPAKCYKKIQRAFTRRSKYKKRAYIKSVPALKVVKFDLGDLKKKFPKEVSIISKEPLQIRQNSLESSRIVINRGLQKQLGKNYHLKLRVYPHHILRENKILTGAGADRMSSGMQRAYGKTIGLASQVKKGQKIFSAYVDGKDTVYAREVMKKAIHRLPCKCHVEIEDFK